VRLNPGASEWRFHLAARGGETPKAPPAEYVASLFDSYAERFDEHLVGELGYRGPEQLLAAVTAAAPDRKLDIMDLGCGTGLCGAMFRPLAKTLMGCDLSPQMVKAAKNRGCYDEVLVGDIRAALADRKAQFDLILAADVFIYVGDLAEVFPLAYVALRAGGLFAFTVEAHDGSGYVLRPTRRYAHNLEYLRGLATANGFVEQSAETVVLRTDRGAEVRGWVVVLRK
jgi:predicted TPR repeat methyltransferase